MVSPRMVREGAPMRAEFAPLIETARPDHLLMAEMIQRGARVLELSQSGVNNSVAHGLSVIQGDADKDLDQYPDDAFDYVILSQTLQATRHPRAVMENLLRIGRRAVVSVPNFGHWRMRMQLLTKALPETWYDTQNIHLCTIRDFVDLCDEVGAHIERAVALDVSGKPVGLRLPWWFWNLFGAQAVFLLRRS